jgi:alpha-D-ribose 1-methylphosphonate 5-triphosphate synthase subunit PhnH
MNDLSPGFANAAQAQTCFRAVLRALSRPGEIVNIAGDLPCVAPLSPATAAILLTLADATTAVSLEGEKTRDWLVFHTGARMAALHDADFVVARNRPQLGLLRNGTDDEPENGATLILDVEVFGGRPCRLAGPGIEREIILPLPLDEDFFTEWAAWNKNLPRGVDILLCAGRQVIGLPRGTKIEAL